MFSKEYNTGGHYVNTLCPSYIGQNESGWLIKSVVHEDYYKWGNEFEASHPVYGKLYGNFETIVYGDSEEGFNHFIQHHPPSEWDYWDI